jgi:hypothetical protein
VPVPFLPVVTLIPVFRNSGRPHQVARFAFIMPATVNQD